MPEAPSPPVRPPNPRLWQPGQSGNPGGRPRIVAAVRAAAQGHSLAAIDELARLSFEAEDERVRVAAIRELLDRGIGKPEKPSQAQAAVSLAQVLQAMADRSVEHVDVLTGLRAGMDARLLAHEPDLVLDHDHPNQITEE